MFTKIALILIIVVFHPAISFSQENTNQIEEDTQKASKERLKEDNRTNSLQYAFFAHKPFYFLPLTYSFNPNKNASSSLQEVDRVEAKFQFSFKINIIDNFYKDQLRLSFAYTNLSFWQLYNIEDSKPFRETNHEPDVFLEYKPAGISSVKISNYYRFGLVHQSNGQDVELSRSWNRLYLQMFTNIKYAQLSLKAWYRLPEDPKETPDSLEGDSNPDITDFLGNFELQTVSKFKGNTLGINFRNNLKKENKGAVEVTLSFPIGSKFSGYFQYFNGYGESLIDYDNSIQRVGVGIVMADWL